MPSVADRILTRGARPALLAVHGQTITVLTGDEAGEEFVGLLAIAPMLDAEGLLGADPRPRATVQFANDSTQPGLSSQDQISADDATWKIVRLVSNPAEPVVEYEVVKVVSGKDV